MESPFPGMAPYLERCWKGVHQRLVTYAIRVPLRANEPDVVLELQPLIARAYANGRYDMDYGAEPDPPLESEDAAWADALLRSKGLR